MVMFFGVRPTGENTTEECLSLIFRDLTFSEAVGTMTHGQHLYTWGVLYQ